MADAPSSTYLIAGADADLEAALTSAAVSRGCRLLFEGAAPEVETLAGALFASPLGEAPSLAQAVEDGPTRAFRFLRHNVSRLRDGGVVVMLSGGDDPHRRVAEEALLGLARAAAEDLRSRRLRVRCLSRKVDSDPAALAEALLDALADVDFAGGLRVLL